KGQSAYQPGEYELDLEAMVTVNKGAINYSKFHVLRAAKAPARATA
ncbi:single-stranded DNA-binding protein, partial [Xanthomonas vasicola pv. vasculorum]